jgi:predicted ATPase
MCLLRRKPSLYTPKFFNDELVPPPTPVQPLLSGPDLPAADKPRPLFVGRERELSVLQSHLEAAVAGDGRILFITGEAGQGKTSLMAEFAHRSLSGHPDLVIAAGACQALIGMADPYLPFRDLIAMLNGDWQRPWLGGNISVSQAQRLLAIAPQTAQAIEAHAPDLVDILVSASERQPRREPQDRSLNQHQIFHQMGQFLRALAAQQPLILLLDDLQWIDRVSANLLFYLGRQLANSPILIVGAYRPSEVSRKDGGEHPLAPVVQELVRYRGDIRVDLDTSLPAEERSFIDALLDSEPNQLNASFREAMYRRTKGNPLFTVELLRALQDQGDLVKDEAGMWSVAADLDWGILPARVEAVIARRIETLPQALRRVLAVASVEGESFTVEVLAQVQGLAVRVLLHELSQELDQRYRLVREQGEWRLGGQSITRYQFRHNLFQQYLYHQLSSAERRTLHGKSRLRSSKSAEMIWNP